jgi:uncharacterized protein
MNKLRKVLDDCQNTGSWFGIKIASVDARNDFGNTPLHTVCTWGDPELVKTLLDAGANINAIGEHGATPIFNGVMSNSVDVVQLLVTRGANKNAKIFESTALIDYAKNIGASDDILSLLRKK